MTVGRRDGVLLAIGAALRLAQYLAGRGYWLDENSLAQSIHGRPLAALLGPSPHDQLAPPGFLLVEWLLDRVFGASPWSLRLFPLACGLAALVLFAALARRVLEPRPASLALAMFAIAHDLIYFSSELKPYMVDVASTLALTLAGLELHGRPLTPRRLALAAASGAAVVWFSFPSAFVLGGLGSVGIGLALARRDWRRVGGLLLAAAIWAASFALCVVVSWRQLGGKPGMWVFWGFAFPPWPPSTASDLLWPLRRSAFYFLNPLDYGYGPWPAVPALAVMGLALAGLVVLWRRELPLLLGLLLPGGLAFLASGLRLYPFHGRMLLFEVPAALLLIASGADLVRRRLGRAAWAVALAAILLVPGLDAAYRVIEPRMRHGFNPRGDYRPGWLDPDRFPTFWRDPISLRPPAHRST